MPHDAAPASAPAPASKPAEAASEPTPPCILCDTPIAGVRRITLNRPRRLNALTEELLTQLRDALVEAAGDADVRCVLINGAGKGFCAGQDLTERDPRVLAEMPDIEDKQTLFYHPLVQQMRTMDTPVVVAVHGIAAGAGAGIALAGDIVLAADTARFVMSFAKVGLSVDAGVGWQLTQALGPARARGLLLTGGTLNGTEAADVGLIWRAMPGDALANRAVQLATQIAAGPTQAHSAIKAAVAAVHETPDFASYLAREAAHQGAVGKSRDYREGVLAFLEKRDAAFMGE